ncbi:cyclic di-GMP phosphodiesterase Gmr [Oxobacter pfennigii]|uniref:Cyclic di-GMP phosphodiesterase Gmr n=1 Tax=Oxobacter pfennigii TaxID=36849 RepID=A0A0N8NT36_9CLOT|nr:EAL domain-containing protein [Oxobacter pfennigii]KPU43736.1 cyclic di-GMP phosphodiesterase Gmr [Oxobacter pfennigii]
MEQDVNEVKEENNRSYWYNFSGEKLPGSKEFNPGYISVRITLVYMFLGALWILLSDKVLEMIISDKQALIRISMLKGWIYVVVTGILIFALIYPALKKIKANEEKIIESYQELTSTYEELEAAHEEIAASEEELRSQFDSLMDSEKKLTESEDKLHHMAYHDILTGLPNRWALDENFGRIFANSVFVSGALFFIDLDNFKFINDSMGHSFGDELIKSTGERLKELLLDKGTVYRLGGDEFIVVLENIEKQEDAERFAAQILMGFKKPFKVGEKELHVNISIGVSLYPYHGMDSNELLRCADIAMYKAKESGRSRYVVYTQPMNEMVAERALIEKNLRTALENDEFELYYQPQLEIKKGAITGLEALLRWKSKELGYVSPLKFIKIAEDTQLIMPIGEWVLNKACLFLKKLHDQGEDDINIAVNISMLQLLQDDFADVVLKITESHGLNPEFLELEVTESVLMESYSAIEGKLKLLCSKGVKIALDDFGKGYSSLSYLKLLPISTLKIDKSFIDSISTESEDKALTGQIVMMGRTMGLNVVAEGVETLEQLEYLNKYKCHKIQGNYFSKPLPEKDAEMLIIRGDVAR